MNPSKKTRFQLDVERIVLPNGLILLLSQNDSIPSVSINAVVQAGSRFESDEEAGLASLVGEMIDEGTESRSSHQIAEAIEAVGGRLAAYGDYQSSGVALLMLSKDAALGLDVAADLLMNSVFPEDKLKLQIERRVAQIRSRYDVPRNQASDEFNEIVFAGSPQHRPPIGYEDTVVKLTRETVDAFYRRHYKPESTIVSVVGDIDREALRHQVEDLFGGWRSSNLDSTLVVKPLLQHKPVEKFVDVPKEQVNIFVGHLGVERTNPDYYALVVMETILGSSAGFTSRIPRILRDEQGLAYTTFANITSSAGLDPGRFVAYIGTSPENLERALAGLRGEIARIVEEPVSQQEVDVAKAYLTGSFVFRLQKNAQVADFLTDAVVYGLGFDYPQRYPEIIRGITAEDVTRVARTYLHPDRLTTVVVGPVAGNKD
jgi:zinc protease